MNLNSVKVPKMSGGGATSALIKFGVIVGLSVYGVANSLYNVEGGHRAIVFNRIGGVKNKQKVQQESGVIFDFPTDQFAPKVIHPQKKPVAAQTGKLKPSLSKDVFAGVLGGQ